MESLQSAEALVRSIDAILPQTQCTQCGYPACLPYARAIATEGAPINRCPPGGPAVIQALAELVNQPVVPLDRACGISGPLQVARIVESLCIGCTLCIRACPVDAIIGAPKKMHVVIGEFCTGCRLCLAPCPVDCITMEPTANPEWTQTQADQARERHHQVQRRAAERDRLLVSTIGKTLPAASDATLERRAREAARRATLAQAVARARAKRTARHGTHS